MIIRTIAALALTAGTMTASAVALQAREPADANAVSAGGAAVSDNRSYGAIDNHPFKRFAATGPGDAKPRQPQPEDALATPASAPAPAALWIIAVALIGSAGIGRRRNEVRDDRFPAGAPARQP